VLKLESTAFVHGGKIPSTYTCDGENISPPLQWSGVPAAARSLVLIVDDPDAPDPNAPRMTWVHWVLYNIPTNTSHIAEGVSPAKLPPGSEEGLNDWKKRGYGGACPPIGRHRYFHKLYALNTLLEGLRKPTKSDIEVAMKGHIIEEAALIGTYEKSP
jgi:Raf kinase inhibitor-like YbhB/YbcL family protein